MYFWVLKIRHRSSMSTLKHKHRQYISWYNKGISHWCKYSEVLIILIPTWYPMGSFHVCPSYFCDAFKIKEIIVFLRLLKPLFVAIINIGDRSLSTARFKNEKHSRSNKCTSSIKRTPKNAELTRANELASCVLPGIIWALFSSRHSVTFKNCEYETTFLKV